MRLLNTLTRKNIGQPPEPEDVANYELHRRAFANGEILRLRMPIKTWAEIFDPKEPGVIVERLTAADIKTSYKKGRRKKRSLPPPHLA